MMDNDLIPPRSSSRRLAPSNPLSRSTSRSRVTHEASDDIAAPQLIRRGNSDSASLTLERHLKQPARSGETWRDFLQEAGTAGESSTRAGSTRTLRGVSGLPELYVTPGVTLSSASTIQAQRTDRSPERRAESFREFQQRFGSMRSTQARDKSGSGAVEIADERRTGQSTLRRAATSSAIEGRHTGRKRNPSTAAEAEIGKKRAPNVTSSESTSSTTLGGPSNIIDLTSPTRAIPIAHANPAQPSTDLSQQQSGPNVILPRWQRDDEVDSCTVCGNAFSLWYRRHHCRKCGRVVCSNCSPHRITIPRQFIVQPPSFSSFSALAAPPTNAENTTSDFASRLAQGLGEYPPTATAGPLTGAEVVRVCNPCVPDPNFSPPPQATSGGGMPSPALLPSNGRPQIPAHHGSLAVNTMPPQRQADARFSAYQFLQQGYSGAPQARSASLALPTTTPTTSGSFRASANPFATIQRHSVAGVPIFGRQQAPSRAPTQPLPQPTQPRRVIKEEDECPVCGRELPTKGPDGNETAREQHVMDCINSHSGHGSASTVAPVPTSETAASPQAVSGTPEPAVAGPSSAPNASAPIATHASRRTSSLVPPAVASSSGSLPQRRSISHASPSVQGSPLSSTPTQPPSNLAVRPHAPRMLVYQATEKDCTTSDGEPQECVICFEEFEEGDEMARLECLCKFHKKCIAGWFVKRAREGEGMGCPTHVLGVWG